MGDPAGASHLKSNEGVVTLADMARARLEVDGPLGSLLPEGINRGSTVTAGSIGLAMTLIAAIQGDAWTAGIGWGSLGMVAARELGVDWNRLIMVAASRESWTSAVSAALDAFDVVAVVSAGQPAGEVRRLSARARERGAVLVVINPPPALGRPVGAWSGAADVRLRVAEGDWRGLGDGHGYLQSRRVAVEVTGRGRLAQPRRAELWLPARDGRILAIEPSALTTPVPASENTAEREAGSGAAGRVAS